MTKALHYFSLTKPRLMLMALLTTFTGYYMAPGRHDTSALMHALLGAALVGGGANALNQYIERFHDSKMMRTQKRPLPSGQISEAGALFFGVLLSLAGICELFFKTNALAALIGVLTLVSYIGWYTPLKRQTTFNTLIGAIPGAAPVLIGWAAARGQLEPAAWTIFGFLFVWQLPHFLAIAWVYREDYARGGFRMTAAGDASGLQTGRRLLILTSLLIAVSFLPFLAGLTGLTYMFMSIFCGVFMIGFSAYLYSRGGADIRKFIPLTILYLFLLNLSMILDKTSV